MSPHLCYQANNALVYIGFTLHVHTMQIARAAVRAEENAQLQQPQDAAVSGAGKGGAEKGGAGQLATGGGLKAPVKVRPSTYLISNGGKTRCQCAIIKGSTGWPVPSTECLCDVSTASVDSRVYHDRVQLGYTLVHILLPSSLAKGLRSQAHHMHETRTALSTTLCTQAWCCSCRRRLL